MDGRGRRARARIRAVRRCQPGEDLDELTEAIMAELAADPHDAVFDQIAAAIPPPGTWDPELRRAVRRLLREIGGAGHGDGS